MARTKFVAEGYNYVVGGNRYNIAHTSNGWFVNEGTRRVNAKPLQSASDAEFAAQMDAKAEAELDLDTDA